MVTVNKLFLKKKEIATLPLKRKTFFTPDKIKIVFTERIFPCDIYTSQSREEQAEFSRQILSFPGRSKRRTSIQLMKTL